MAEKQNNVQKKKKSSKAGGKLVLLLVLIIAVLILLLLIDPFGWGLFGKGSGGGTSDGGAQTSLTAEANVSEQNDEAVQTEEQGPVYIDVKISGAAYFYNGEESSVSDILADASSAQGDVTVRITDDSATQNAVEDLTSGLDKLGIKYTIE